MTVRHKRTDGKILFDQEMPPTGEIVTAKFGPFQRDEDPHIRVFYKNVDPENSVVCENTRLDNEDTYSLVYIFQNYGIKTARVTVRRMD